VLSIQTIGVYGFTETAFLDALKSGRVDAVIDIRKRRGMRGSVYAFANASRLQLLLVAEGIQYLHLKSLAPDDDVRELQRESDKRGRIRKRGRETLSIAFAEEYNQRHLARFDPSELLDRLDPTVGTIALFCVEREPSACHRSLVARHLAEEFGGEVAHLRP
jgi:uncharacterized protein (DUF488 family)